ncbi:MAG: T9SS type A sorting domain-containing protein [Ignavibacteriaceae bacterium]|nr:T9SS type A sorting domain-containing protein [Ignavibacteriaceae bacterium]
MGFNDQCGIYIDTSLSNSLNRNSISKNGGKGIETINGGNKDIVPPLILSASPSIVTGTSSPGCIIEIFSDDEDEGRYFLGSTTADSSGNFALTITEPIPLSHVTATCTDAEGNTSEFSAPFIVTNVKFVKNEIPTEFGLHQNFPNPFNPITNISWQSPVSGRHTLKVYDILGKEVAALVNDEKEAGYHSIDFDASNLTSGVYFCRLTIKEFHSTIRMILIR